MLKTEMSIKSSITNMKVKRTAERIKRGCLGLRGGEERAHSGVFNTNLAMLCDFLNDIHVLL